MAIQHCRPAEMGNRPPHLRRQSLEGWYTKDGVLDWRETALAYAGPARAGTNFSGDALRSRPKFPAVGLIPRSPDRTQNLA
jgi:hypothetical protein